MSTTLCYRPRSSLLDCSPKLACLVHGQKLARLYCRVGRRPFLPIGPSRLVMIVNPTPPFSFVVLTRSIWPVKTSQPITSIKVGWHVSIVGLGRLFLIVDTGRLVWVVGYSWPISTIRLGVPISIIGRSLPISAMGSADLSHSSTWG